MVRRLEMHRREYDFYRLAAGQAQVRTPRLYYGDCDARGTRFVLVLEDLGEMEQGDQAAGASREQAMAALRALARLHGSFWNGKTGRLAGLYDLLARRRRGWLQLAYALFLARTLARYGSLFTPEMRRLAEAYAPRVAEHVARVAAGPISLIHGDFRLDNLFFGREDGADAAVIDWQVSGWSAPLYDVAYFLGSSVHDGIAAGNRARRAGAVRGNHAQYGRGGILRRGLLAPVPGVYAGAAAASGPGVRGVGAGGCGRAHTGRDRGTTDADGDRGPGCRRLYAGAAALVERVGCVGGRLRAACLRLGGGLPR